MITVPVEKLPGWTSVVLTEAKGKEELPSLCSLIASSLGAHGNDVHPAGTKRFRYYFQFFFASV